MRGHRSIECKICKKDIKPFFYARHVQEVHGNLHLAMHEKNIKCKKCKKFFSSNSELKRHMVLHDNPEKLTCKICKKIISTPYSLKKHTKLYHGPKDQLVWFTCDKCEYSTITNTNLKRHQLTHKN